MKQQKIVRLVDLRHLRGQHEVSQAMGEVSTVSTAAIKPVEGVAQICRSHGTPSS